MKGRGMKYDPRQAVDAEVWNASDDDAKLEAVLRFHRRERHPLPKDRARAHALFHIVIENQIAMGGEYVAQAVLERLIGEGLDRHQAVHAMASVMTDHVYNASKWGGPGAEFGGEYTRKLTQLTAEGWRRRFRDLASPEKAG